MGLRRIVQIAAWASLTNTRGDPGELCRLLDAGPGMRRFRIAAGSVALLLIPAGFLCGRSYAAATSYWLACTVALQAWTILYAAHIARTTFLSPSWDELDAAGIPPHRMIIDICAHVCGLWAFPAVCACAGFIAVGWQVDTTYEFAYSAIGSLVLVAQLLFTTGAAVWFSLRPRLGRWRGLWRQVDKKLFAAFVVIVPAMTAGGYPYHGVIFSQILLLVAALPAESLLSKLGDAEIRRCIERLREP